MRKGSESENEKNDYNQLVPAVEQAAKIILFLCSMPNLQSNLTDISAGIGISKSKAYAILNTLQRFGFVYRNAETKLYSVGLYMMSIGQKVMDNISYSELCAPFLRELSEDTKSTAALGIIAGDNQYVIVRQESTDHLRIHIRSDRVYPLTYGAHGKAIVAFLPEDEQKKILSEKTLFFYRDPQLLNRRLLSKELKECRETGYALDHRTGHPIVKIIASPILDTGEKMIGTIQIIGLIEERDIKACGAKVAETAKRFSQMLATGKTARH
jgi:DNA-binding IclR family transcriptional regulator